MKYKIVITTFVNGRKEYQAYVKSGWFWTGLDYQGANNTYTSKFSSRESALKAIDLHYDGNNKKQTVEVEYINK